MSHDDAAKSPPLAAKSPPLAGVGTPGPRTGQKIGWGVLLIFVLAGAAGAFGEGRLSHASLERGDLRVDYERVLRALAESELRVGFVPASPPVAQLAVEPADPRDLEIRAVFPRPLRERASARGPILELAVDGGGPLEVRLRSVPLRPGRHLTRLRVDGREPVVIRQWVLP